MIFKMVLLFVLLLFTRKCYGTTTCSNEYQCASFSLNVENDIYCHGFASCIYAQTIVTKTGFYAYGSYAAYGAINVTSGDDSVSRGESSCRNISHFQTYNDTYCHGYRSCFGSTFERTNSTNGHDSRCTKTKVLALKVRFEN